MVGTGEIGAGATIAKEANKYGIPVVNMTYDISNVTGNKKHNKLVDMKKRKVPGFTNKLGIVELQNVDKDIDVANLSLKRTLSKTKTRPNSMALIRREIWNAKEGDALYAWGEIETSDYSYPTKGKKPVKTNLKMRAVKGLPGWSVQHAIDKGKRTYVFNQNENKWYEWSPNNNRFVRIVGNKPPRPPKRWAVTGTDKLNNTAKSSIKEFF